MTTNQKFEYAIISAQQHGKGLGGAEQVQLLQKCGEECWELVAVIPKADDVWFYFKQPKGKTFEGFKEMVKLGEPIPKLQPIEER